MSGTITTYRMVLEGIRFRARHGVSKAERGLPQDFVATVEIELPLTAFPKTDSLRNVFDYGRLAEIVVEEGTRASHRLLETLADKLDSLGHDVMIGTRDPAATRARTETCMTRTFSDTSRALDPGVRTAPGWQTSSHQRVVSR